jgi:signal transduction histidine kinase
MRERIFMPFYTTRTRGTGLGLSIVKKIAEGHNGKVTLECPPEGGSIFTLWLPKIDTHGSKGLQSSRDQAHGAFDGGNQLWQRRY